MKDPEVQKKTALAGAVLLGGLCLLPFAIIFIVLAAVTSFLWVPALVVVGLSLVIFSDLHVYGLGPKVRALFGWAINRLLFNSGPL